MDKKEKIEPDEVEVKAEPKDKRIEIIKGTVTKFCTVGDLHLFENMGWKRK